MNQQALHNKIIEMSRKNKKAVSGLAQHLLQLKKQKREEQNSEILNYRKEYEELLKLNQESEQESLRIRKELTIIDFEIEQLELKNTMSRSRIKLQSEEIENIKDETEDIDKQRRREDKREKEHVELKKEVERLEEDILSLETEFEDRNRGLVELQNHYASLIEKKESMSINRKQNHRKHKTKVQELQQHLRELKNQVNALRNRKEKQEEKTKRNNKVETIHQIWEMINKHKERLE